MNEVFEELKKEKQRKLYFRYVPFIQLLKLFIYFIFKQKTLYGV